MRLDQSLVIHGQWFGISLRHNKDVFLAVLYFLIFQGYVFISFLELAFKPLFVNFRHFFGFLAETLRQFYFDSTALDLTSGKHLLPIIVLLLSLLTLREFVIRGKPRMDHTSSLISELLIVEFLLRRAHLFILQVDGLGVGGPHDAVALRSLAADS